LQINLLVLGAEEWFCCFSCRCSTTAAVAAAAAAADTVLLANGATAPVIEVTREDERSIKSPRQRPQPSSTQQETEREKVALR
jgi:hypothetical protein